METGYKEDIVYERLNPSRKPVGGQVGDGVYYRRLPEKYRRQFVFKERKSKSQVFK